MQSVCTENIILLKQLNNEEIENSDVCSIPNLINFSQYFRMYFMMYFSS